MKRNSNYRSRSLSLASLVLPWMLWTALVAPGAWSAEARNGDDGAVPLVTGTVESGAAKWLLQAARSGFYPSSGPTAMVETTVRGKRAWRASPKAVVATQASSNDYDCDVNFNDAQALSFIPNHAADTFAFAPWWLQVCNLDRSAYVRPYKINHFHLNYENATCYELGMAGEMQPDGSCKVFDEPVEQPRSLHSMLPADVVELQVLDDSSGTPVRFDFKRIRVIGNHSVRVCYKPVAEANDGPWLAQTVDEIPSGGVWMCWNNMPTGYWDVSPWAGDVSAVRLIAVDGAPNFAVDDILINASPQ